ncbi:divalent-cation tolerance protein CutA [Castellaniella sp. S9]|uniref:divalent-cation tolerance protein CutA n=1 Tax=Castellaniella sp. S9 TaxID=2993652 RepID=UPI0022B4D291|nr:divalent-cation tolerance protein CutA [Castellaniella sp. S9]
MTDDRDEATGAAGLRTQQGGAADAVVVLSTAPDTLLAKRIAHILVEESLAACVHVGAPGVSMYLWQGKLEGGDEVPMTLKTTAARLPALYARLCQLHPYEVPEFLVLAVHAGNAGYLDWVAQMASAPADAGRGVDLP